MRKAIPCEKCGIAQLPVQGDYIVGSVPAKLTINGGIFTWKCLCGKLGKMNRSQWNAIPEEKEIDAKAEEAGRS